MQTFAWTSTCLAFNAAKIRLQRGFNFSVWRPQCYLDLANLLDCWSLDVKISEEQTTSQLRCPHLRRPNPKCDHLFHAVSCCFVLLASQCWLWCFHVHLAIQIYLIQELWRCFNKWLQHLRSQKNKSETQPFFERPSCGARNLCPTQ